MPKHKRSKNKSTTRIRLSNELIEKANHIAKIYDITLHEALDLLVDDAINGLGTALSLVPAFKPVNERECRETTRH